MKKQYYLIKHISDATHKVTYYFQIENPARPGQSTRKSTGKSTRREAAKYVEELLRNRDEYLKLFPVARPIDASMQERKPNGSPLIFKDYAKDWWDWDKCLYVRARRSRSTPEHPRIKKCYTDKALSIKRLYLIPFFGEMELSAIMEEDVELFFSWLLDKGLAPKTVNDIRSFLMIMMGWACRNRIIDRNPVSFTLKFPVEKRNRVLLTRDEASRLFSTSNISFIWKNNHICYIATLLAYQTGMRQGEILALKPENLLHYKQENSFYINVCYSYSDKYGISTTKNSEKRIVPISKNLYGILLWLASSHNNYKFGYIFSLTGNKPVAPSVIRTSFANAITRIGISDSERKKRSLTFHSLRASFVTNSRNSGMSDTKVAAITGHKTLSMLNIYTSYDRTQLDEVIRVQEELEAML